MKKNIAIIITRLDLGGAQKVALYLAENLDRKKFNVHLIAGKGGYLDGKLGIRNSEPGVKSGSTSAFRAPRSALTLNLWPELVHPINPIFDIMAYFKLLSYFEKNKIDIVHTHSSKAGILGRMAAYWAGVPAVIHTIHGFPFHKYQDPIVYSIYWMIEKICSFVTTKFIAVGSDVMNYGLKKGIGRKEQYVVIRPGVDLKAFKGGGRKAEGGRWLEKYGLKLGVFTVGMIGNCKKQKNPMAFAKIARFVIKEKPATQFIFAGDGPLKDDAEEYVKRYKISDRVKFIGWTDEPEIFMKSIDLFLLTSLWEGIPCTLAQAAAAHRPIVASNIEGNREFMEAIGASAYLYDPQKTDEAAGKILQIAEAGIKAYRYSPEKILKEFDLKYMQKQHEKLYKSR